MTYRQTPNHSYDRLRRLSVKKVCGMKSGELEHLLKETTHEAMKNLKGVDRAIDKQIKDLKRVAEVRFRKPYDDLTPQERFAVMAAQTEGVQG